MIDTDILNIEEACQFLKISKATLYRYIKEGKVPAVSMGGKNWRFHKKLLEEWIIKEMEEGAQSRAQNRAQKRKEE